MKYRDPKVEFLTSNWKRKFAIAHVRCLQQAKEPQIDQPSTIQQQASGHLQVFEYHDGGYLSSLAFT